MGRTQLLVLVSLSLVVYFSRVLWYPSLSLVKSEALCRVAEPSCRGPHVIDADTEQASGIRIADSRQDPKAFLSQLREVSRCAALTVMESQRIRLGLSQAVEFEIGKAVCLQREYKEDSLRRVFTGSCNQSRCSTLAVTIFNVQHVVCVCVSM